MSSRYFLTCNYTEFKPETFRGFILMRDFESYFINDEDPIKAWGKVLEFLDHRKVPYSKIGVGSGIHNYLEDSENRELALLILGEEQVNPNFGKDENE